MDGCLFCKIIRREIPATIVHEDERSLAFRDINPVAKTHLLIIPKTHVATINDVAAEHELDMGHLFRVAAQVAKAEGIAESGYRAVMNCGAEAGQSVFHVHLHVVGGRPLGWPPFPKS
jgi:histidine triad (HIT) family protein